MNRLSRLAFGAVLSMLAVPLFAQGPGLGQPTWSSTELFRVVSRIRSTNASGAARGNSNVAMHNGYLVVGYAPDSGRAGGGFSFYNVSNPRSPQLVFRRDENALREPHGFGFSYSYPGKYTVLQAINGIQFWDWTNVTSPQLLRYMTLSGIQESDYASGAWWCFFQAPYVYVGGSGNGIYIVDARDPRNPTLVRRVATSATGGFRVGPVFAIGNLMVISSADVAGIATLDISDPGNPTLLRSTTTGGALYSVLANGPHVYAANNANRLDIFDVNTLARLRSSGSTGDKGGYVSTQDGFVHMGSSGSYRKIRISDAAIVGTATKPDSAEDWDFATALGNWVFVGQDHSQGSPIVPHQSAPDTTPPAVNMVNPADGAVNRALTSRVGLTFTDAIDLDTVNSSTFIVRPVGGSALPGKYSGQTQILNFWPDQPLLANTTYEVVIPAGGLRDWSGNAIAATFTAQFSTGGSVGPTPTPTSTPVGATPTPTNTPVAPTPTPTNTPAGTDVEITPAGSAVTASTNDGNVPANTVDNNLATRWSGNGDGAWIQYDLGTAQAISYVKIAVYNGNTRQNRYDLQVGDGTAWTNVITNGLTTGTTTQLVTYDFPDQVARFVRYVGHGSTANTFNSLTEVEIWRSTCTSCPTPTPTNTPVVPTVTPSPTPTATPTPGGSVPECTLGTRAASATNTSVSFSPASTSGSPTEYSWDFGDGAASPFSTSPNA